MRLSYSTNNLVHTCPRKYQLTKLNGQGSDASNENNVHFDYGTALGAGLQCLMHTKNRELAITVALSQFYWNETAEKCWESIVLTLMNYEISDDWAVHIKPDGTAALELSFKIVLGIDPETGKEDYYCGYMDAVLFHRFSGQLAVFECKTTGSNLSDLEPYYSNSPQGVGYSVILGAISPDVSFTVYYPVIQLIRTWKPKIHIYEFNKTIKDRLEWLINLKLDYDQLCQYRAMSYYPQRGQNCVTFSKPCHLFGICGLDAMTDTNIEAEKAEDDWDYTFHLEELIDATEKQLLGDKTNGTIK